MVSARHTASLINAKIAYSILAPNLTLDLLSIIPAKTLGTVLSQQQENIPTLFPSSMLDMPMPSEACKSIPTLNDGGGEGQSQ